MKLKASKYLVVTSPIVREKHIIYSTRTNSSFLLSGKILSDIKKGDFSTLPIDIKAKLIEAEIIVPEEENELDSVLSTFKDFTNQSTFGLTIQPSGNCQLGCHYCGQQHAKFEMSEETFNNTVMHAAKKLDEGSYKTLFVTWYGAEPLMSLTNIDRLSNAFLKLCEERKIHYRANMITNGMSLKPKIFELLTREFKVLDFQITLDGDKDYHDNSRFMKNGAPSFDIIYRNIRDCVLSPVYEETKAQILLRCNVTKENSGGINNLLRRIQEDGFQDRIIVDLAPVHDWGGNNANQKGFSRQDFAEREIDWIMLMRDLGFKAQPLLPARKHNTCMVTSGDSSELIDASGNLTYCWETTYTPKYAGSDYIVGNVNNEETYFPHKDDAPLKNWYDLIPTGKSWCKDCNFLPVCGGSCPVAWAKDEPPCPSFKYNFADRLVLEYLSARK